jgi:methyl-accepting chemotaxis protein
VAEEISVARPGECLVPPSSRPEMGLDYSDTSPAMLDGVREAGADNQLWEDDYGNWLSGYAPIFNSAGEPVGAVGVDMCATEVISLQQNIRRNVAIALAISLVALISVVWFIARGVTRPVLALTRVADRIGSGDYDQDFSSLHSSRVQDEVDTLATVFEMMVGKVYTREQSLRARVQQLEIMIDQGKRDREVQQIVESDFFQDLQGKVSEMRNRFRKED